jgi:hypothetical protein
MHTESANLAFFPCLVLARPVLMGEAGAGALAVGAAETLVHK